VYTSIDLQKQNRSNKNKKQKYMIRSCIKRLALLANLAGKGNLLVLTLLLVVLSSLILAYQAIYTREQAGAAPNTNINFQARILTNTGALVLRRQLQHSVQNL
jgi:hypothetical protein